VDTACDMMGITYTEEIKILCAKMRNTEEVGAGKLDEIDVLGTHASSTSIQQRAQHSTTHYICTGLYACQIMIHCASATAPPPVSASGKLYWPLRVIYMAGRHCLSATINTAEAKKLVFGV